MSDNLEIFIPLTKVDEEKRLVYGIATAEEPDSSGEICDYASTKPYYEKWSSEFEKATDGKSLGNLRVMHGKVAAGPIKKIHYNDDEKQIEICAKVVDDNEWKKVLEGVYTGFSQGGGYVRKWKDPSDPTKMRYTARPGEVSLVDTPCLKKARFQIQKMDGSVVEHEFATPSQEEFEQDVDSMIQLVASGLAIEKFEDVTRWPEMIDDASEGIVATFEKYSSDQPRDSSGKWASAAIGAALGGAKGAVLGALTAGQAGAVIGGISGAISGAMETSDSQYVRASGEILSAVTSAVGVGAIASRMMQARGAMAAAGAGAKAIIGAAETGQSAADAAKNLTDPAARGSAEQMLDEMRAKANAQFEAAQTDIDKARTAAQKNFDEAVKRQAAKMKSDTKAAEARSKLKSVKGSKKDDAEKSESTGDLKKMDITNEMVFEKAKKLAEAAGDITKVGDFIETARAELEKSEAPVEPEKKLEKVDEEPKVVEEPKVDEVRQVWLAKDGSHHDKKAEALAKNALLAVGKSPLLEKLDAAIGAKAEDGDRFAALLKYAGEEVWDARRATDALGEIFGLLMKEMSEGEKNSEQVASLQKAVDGLKSFISSEIMEDNSDPAKMVMALSEKLGELAKSDKPDHKKLIQEIHDRTAEMGGACKAEKSEDEGDLAKRAALLDAIEPRLEKLLEINEQQAEQIKKQGDQIAALSRAAMPPPKLTVVEKGGEVSLTNGNGAPADLAKLQESINALSTEEKAVLMMKVAQSQPIPMGAR